MKIVVTRKRVWGYERTHIEIDATEAEIEDLSKHLGLDLIQSVVTETIAAKAESDQQ